MFVSKKKTVREVLASFDKMIDSLDAILNDCKKDIEERKRSIEVMQAEIVASEREIADAQSSRAKLIEIVRGTHEEVPAAVEHVDKVELA